MKMSKYPSLSMLVFATVTSPAWAADPEEGLFDLDDLRVKITESMPYLEVEHAGKKVLLMRHQEPDHQIVSPFDLTSRDCPPFCVQPMRIAEGVETIGELELIDMIRRSQESDSIIIIDSRTKSETERGMIPGAISLPYTRLDPAHASPEDVAELLQFEFGAILLSNLWNFSDAKTLVFYCNGPWCGQSPTNIRALLTLGYPPNRLKWYRGGMQVWEQFGFTTVRSQTDED